ncbi:LPS-assembly protein LptD [Altererythrobacter sp. MTPC7]|uniref:LPS-assembly protein LptD n=1 Tax=Altererythrobacter sp. MTPC7 TaxID=3056567 RepID=UPI0036F41D92
MPPVRTRPCSEANQAPRAEAASMAHGLPLGRPHGAARFLPHGCAIAALIALPAAPLSAQEGAAPGMATADEPVEVPDARDPVYAGEQETGFPQGGEPVVVARLPGEDAPPALPPVPEDEVAFEADTLRYNSNDDSVTATGNVILRNGARTVTADEVVWTPDTGEIVGTGDVLLSEGDRSVRADRVVWNRNTGGITGTGDVRFVDEDGNQLYTSRIELTEEFQAGSMDDLLLALRAGGRLAAVQGERGQDGSIVLTRAAYSGCAVVDPEGCDRKPSWRITADEVVYSPQEDRVRFSGAYLELFGRRIVPLPGLAVRTDGGPVSGFLVPDLRISESNGVEVSGSYYTRLAPNQDATISGYVFTEAAPMVSAQYRALNERGAFQITGYGTYSSRISDFTGVPTTEDDFRGYVFANGKAQFDPNWSLTGSLRVASDRTFLRRYDISRDDRLRSLVELERIDADSYLLVAGYSAQTLILGRDQGQVPLALPAIDYRRRLRDPVLGGQVEVQANSLAIFRDEGQDTQRAFVRAQWDLRRITQMGQVVQFSALARGDVYHSDENALTPSVLYRGDPGFQTRGIGLAAVDVKWPFAGELLGGTQVLTPRVQVVASPGIKNLAVPNEDARAIDLEDSNLFALNRFPGYDRIEDGVRITYGLDWQLNRPGWRVKTTVGQSYRLDTDRDILVDGTGLSERVSDFVGRTEVRYKDFVSFTHRFRLDKDNLAVRRNEIDTTIGSRRTYVELGYLRLDRDISEFGLEDLQDREELRAAARIAFADYWSVFGSGIFNLTDREEDPTLSSDGFQPLRTRLGVAYQDDCLEMGLTWRRDFTDQGDAERGNTFQVYFSLRNLGFR